MNRLRHLPSDPTYALEALRAAWRRGALDDAAAWLDHLPGPERTAWLTDVRSRLDIGTWLGGLDGATALRWLHRFVPWTEARVVIHDESQNRKGAMPLIDAFPWICADHTLHLTEPCELPWLLAWSPRAAYLLACDCAERAIDHTERVLSSWESRRPDDMRPRRAIEAARACVAVVRRGGSTREMSEARTAAYAAYAASSAAGSDVDGAYYFDDSAFSYVAHAAANAALSAYAASSARADLAAERATNAAIKASYDTFTYVVADAFAYAAAAGRCQIEVPAAERAWQAERLWDYLCGVAS